MMLRKRSSANGDHGDVVPTATMQTVATLRQRSCAIWDRDSWWDIPRKHALFTSDGPDSTTSGSDIQEGYADRPPEYSEGLISRRPQDDGGTERLYSPSIDLEKAVIQLQKEVNDCRTELKLARKQTPAVALWPPRRSGFTSTPVPRYSGVELGTVL